MQTWLAYYLLSLRFFWFSSREILQADMCLLLFKTDFGDVTWACADICCSFFSGSRLLWELSHHLCWSCNLYSGLHFKIMDYLLARELPLINKSSTCSFQTIVIIINHACFCDFGSIVWLVHIILCIILSMCYFIRKPFRDKTSNYSDKEYDLKITIWACHEVKEVYFKSLTNYITI